MAVCFSLTNLELGGAQVFVVRLANYLAQKNKQPVYIYDHWPEFRQENTLHNLHPLVKILSYSESRIERWFIWKLNALFLRLDPRSRFRYDLNKKRLEKLLKKYEITLVNSHMSYSDFVLSGSKLPENCKLVLTLHGEFELLLKESGDDPEKLNSIRAAINKASAVIYTADKNIATVKKLKDVSTIRTQKINIGFDPAVFKTKHISRKEVGLRDGDFVVGMISRGFAEKGWDTAIAAIKEYNTTAQEKITLLCIGNGQYLRELVASANDSFILLQQFDKNYQDYFYCYPLFDLFIFPTRFEGESVPNVLIECLYWKVPMLASQHAEIPVMLKCGTEEAAGICVPFKGQDPAGEFAANLRKMVNDAGLRQKLSANCRAAFLSFSMEAVARQYEKIFEELV